MQFTKENAEKVMTGTKVQTRRAIADDDVFKVARDNAVWTYDKHGKLRKKWQVGRTYAVCPGRGKPAIGRIRLLNIRKEKLQFISDNDICAELGIIFSLYPFPDNLRNMFWTLWDSINPKGKRWVDNPDVWTLTFEVVP